jgi:phospholipid/cholesterol/gamma-HCH transport system substrate-binding protein
VATRGEALRQLVNSLQRLNTALATKQGQIVSLVDSSAKVFRAFASEDKNVSRAIVDLPGTLSQTTATLAKVQAFAKLLGPTATNLLPAARAIPAANQALVALAKPSTPIVKNQIRPFVVAARPLVRNLKPASINLAKATPNLTKTFSTLNHLENMLGYNPGNAEHGYLWWLAWLDHNARTLFSVQDANGVFRPLFLQASCATYAQLIDNLNAASPGLGSQFESLLNITPIVGANGLCPKQAAANQAAYQRYLAQHPGAQAQTANVKSSGRSTGNVSALSNFAPALPVK